MFFKTLYPSQIRENVFQHNDPCSSFLNHNNLPKLNKEKQNICEGLITAEECLSALKTFARNKTPGSDGLTAEFYLCFWECLATPLTDGLLK